MSKGPRSQHATSLGPVNGRATGSANSVFAAALVVFTALLWASLSAPPLALDDQSLLDELAPASFAHVFGYDHFGHLRPAKSAWFWWLSRHPQALWACRTLTLCAALACASCVRWLAQALALSPVSSAAAAAVWLLNPCTVSVTLWLSASNYLFATLGMLAYLRLMDMARAKTALRYFVAAHAALLWAVLNHELALLAPVFLAAQRAARAAMPNGREPAGLRVSTAVAGAAAVAAVLLMLRWSHTARPVYYRSAAHASTALFASSARYLLENLRLWAWPQGYFGVLLVDELGAHPVANALAWGAVVLLLGLGIFAARRDRVSAFAGCWVLGGLLPVSNLVPIGNTPVAVHYLVLPGVGLALLGARALDSLGALVPRRANVLACSAAGVVVAAWQPAFQQSVFAWNDVVPLYLATLRNHPDNIEVRTNLSAVYLERQDYTAAAALLEESLRLAPGDVSLVGNQLELLIATGQPAQAVSLLDAHPEYERAVPEARVRRGLLQLQLERRREAADTFREVLRVSELPQDRLTAGYQLANLLVQQHELTEARRVLDALQREFPDNQAVVLARRLLHELP